ncbi:cytochrome c4 [Ideonella sp. DXS29W]|uniref:Cytochrome c4 n=1 Tax=Ideonella lacteola TaxID=2984193 RepID=A0ABU9BYT9_9BURK
MLQLESGWPARVWPALSRGPTPTNAPTLALTLALALALALAGACGPAQGASAPAGELPPVQDTIAQRMQACTVCHGKEGRATNEGYYPRIAGKPAAYLYNQLQHFKTGQRHFPAMRHLLQHMSDDYLHEIASYFAELDLPYPPAQPSTLAASQQAAARQLVFEGAPSRQIPACVSCHGREMAGMLPATPGLLTLPADYLIGQLGAWRTGQRKAAEPDCMATVAQRLTEDDIAVVSRWLSAQTLPLGTHPAPAPTSPMPMRCGSHAP